MHDTNRHNGFSYLRPALAIIVLMTLITGFGYPVLVSAIGQALFPEQANGSLIRDDQGVVRGSILIAQRFEGEEWFHPRPSAGDFATVSSGASNMAASNPALVERIAKDAARLSVGAQTPVPLALVTTSGSGLDPDLPVAAVQFQTERVARARKLAPSVIAGEVDRLTQRSPIGPDVVNVLQLNLAISALGNEDNTP